MHLKNFTNCIYKLFEFLIIMINLREMFITWWLKPFSLSMDERIINGDLVSLYKFLYYSMLKFLAFSIFDESLLFIRRSSTLSEVVLVSSTIFALPDYFLSTLYSPTTRTDFSEQEPKLFVSPSFQNKYSASSYLHYQDWFAEKCAFLRSMDDPL